VPEPSAAPAEGASLPSPSTLETIAIEAATQGAETIRAAQGRPRSIHTKSSPTDPVTALDLEVEQAIREHLGRLTPGASFLGEEGGDRAGETALGWVLDPIDGTVNLTYGVPFIAVSLAATVAGEVVAGAVIDVWHGEVFGAASGAGARLDGAAIQVSGVDRLAEALVATGFSYSTKGRAAEVRDFAMLLPAARDIRCFGSTALHLCWVACGRIDGYYQRHAKVWDYAAGALIAAEAGARLAYPTLDNGELTLAASPLVFDPLMQLLT
jgi:myo-inositol-1(or 4)-monophosphatase